MYSKNVRNLESKLHQTLNLIFSTPISQKHGKIVHFLISKSFWRWAQTFTHKKLRRYYHNARLSSEEEQMTHETEDRFSNIRREEESTMKINRIEYLKNGVWTVSESSKKGKYQPNLHSFSIL